MSKNILVVEPNPKLAQTIKQHFKQHLWISTIAYNLNQAYSSLGQKNFNLVIVGQAFDDGDGLELVQYLSQDFPKTQVIFYSQADCVSDRLSCLHLGADDFVSKNSSLEELTLKAELLLNKTKQGKEPLVVAGTFKLYPECGTLKICHQHHRLRHKESKVLECLMIHANRTVSKKALLNWCWSYYEKPPHHKSLEVHISRIRNKLGKYQAQLETIRGFGYRLSV